jgi:predicted subunit of tRNA(5-methylaminomethyl-2-thiouridylate) methyltransferase
MKVAKGALDLETLPANGITMCAARNERHIVSSRGQPGAEIAADGTRRHDRDPHLAPSAGQDHFVSLEN